MLDRLKLFTGNSNYELAKKMADYLCIPLGDAEVYSFSDGETFTNINENVRGNDIFIVQSTSTPVDKNLMELLIMVDAMKRASAKRITAVIPYYGYARQDRKTASRVPITSKLVADLITTAGVNRVLAMDLHAGQIQGFFNIPVDHLYAVPIIVKYVKEKKYNISDLVVVAPDAGAVERARAFAKHLGATLAIIDKRRIKANVAEIMNVIGDVKDKVALMLDDMIDTAGTITQGAVALKENGAREIIAMATHGVLSGSAIDKINDSPIKELVITDTIDQKDKLKSSEKIKILSVATLLGEAVKRIYDEDSVSSLFL
ncbi:MAG: ribose-phosphate pyrophosphokinase [Candidatus Acididesulfobacter guangdongensis]|uniref:Ribose-phosphate pyrophosphokinase n=1 Tax=Acididesulfobacter guangdongensis TaxID=2597225 RepID=A0A519BI03_ACIG2|nr:MAG: ribose-phosphate pyrophosphokinase [Candidatus Acididesulfobacter guangdongensis]